MTKGAEVRLSSAQEPAPQGHTYSKKDCKRYIKGPRQPIVEEYNIKYPGDQQKVKLTAYRRNRSENELERQSKRNRVCKDSDTKQPRQALKQQHPGNEIRTVKSFSVMDNSNLRVALPDNNSATAKLAPSVWNSVENRLSEMIIEHLLDSKGE